MILPALTGRRQGRSFTDDDWLEVRLLEDDAPEALFEAAYEPAGWPDYGPGCGRISRGTAIGTCRRR